MRLMGGVRSNMEGAQNDKKRKITTITANCELHPLIHTLMELNLVPDIADTKKSKPKLRQKNPRGGGVGRLS
jgi:hypothetical protein